VLVSACVRLSAHECACVRLCALVCICARVRVLCVRALRFED